MRAAQLLRSDRREAGEEGMFISALTEKHRPLESVVNIISHKKSLTCTCGAHSTTMMSEKSMLLPARRSIVHREGTHVTFLNNVSALESDLALVTFSTQ